MQNRASRYRYARVRKSRPDPYLATSMPMPRVDMEFDYEIDSWVLGGASLVLKGAP